MVTADLCFDKLPLTPRERKALAVAGIHTIDDFLFRDLSVVLLSPGCWRKTYLSLSRTQEELRKTLAQRQGDVSPLEEFLLGNVESLIADARCRSALRHLGTVTVRDFLHLDLRDVPHMPGCGEITRRNLLAAQSELRHEAALLEPAAEEPPCGIPQASGGVPLTLPLDAAGYPPTSITAAQIA